MAALGRISHLRIPFEDIESATNMDTEDENILSKNIECITYRGQLLLSEQLTDIVAQVYDRHDGQGVSKFETNTLMLSSLKHKNIVSFIGFVEDPYWIVTVSKFETRGSLHMYLRKYSTLSWMKRLQICVGIAHGLCYLHYEEGVIHCNIRSSSILLDDNWEPKISYFVNSIRTSVAQRKGIHHAQHSGKVGYMDAAYEKSRGVSHKSDVFSFGVVLFEVLCGRKASVPSKDNESLAQWAKFHYEKGTLEDKIKPRLRKQMDGQSFKIFAEIAYCCLKEPGAQRPSMDKIVKRLQKALKFQKIFDNPKHSKGASEEVTSFDRLKGKNFEHLKIKLSEIEAATENFAESYCIGSGGFGKVYKAQIHLDGKNSWTTEETNTGELPKIAKTVAIKRIFSREDTQGEDGFIAEIEMLSSCKNRNIVSLLGYCDEGPQLILVYEYVSNGSLDNYLGSIDNMTNFTWIQRIRICLDIAHGLDYLHSSKEDKEKIIHRDIKSANILLNENWEAKIADFGLSKFQQATTLIASNIAGTEVYLDPEYSRTGKLKKATDVYSFGVVLFEILCGRVAYDPIYMQENVMGLGPVARRRFRDGTLKEMIDPNLTEESEEIFFTQNRGLNEDSLASFSVIAYGCLAETQAARPTMNAIIEGLEQALSFQENHKDHLKYSLEDIKSATKNFSKDNIIGEEEFWELYKGEVQDANGSNIVVAKRFTEDTHFLEDEFYTELKILYEYKHKNIIGLVGYCNETDERIVLYENASKGSLDGYLRDVNLTWTKRLEICIDVANGLNFLHGSDVTKVAVVHRCIRSSSVLLDDEWKARICNFGLSVISSVGKESGFSHVDTSCTSIDPQYHETGTLTQKSDIYSFGVVLFEILSGTSIYERESVGLGKLVKHQFEEGKLDQRVFESIKENIVPQSLAIFQTLLLQCLHDKREERPTATQVLMHLQKALEFQTDYEKWESKLQQYEEIFLKSKTPDIYSMAKKEDLYNMLLKGILIQEGKLWFSIGSNEERNELISARKFSYKNRWSHRWRSVTNSRFIKVAEMLDISNLNIQINIKPQFLSSGATYGVHLVFRFCSPIKSLAKRMYVNLKYKKGKETLHTYFATWREDGWLTIELCRFLNDKEDIEYEFLLESFSRCYCESRAIYIEGIEFKAIYNANPEEIKESKQVQQVLIKSDLNIDQVQQLRTKTVENYECEKLFSPCEEKKHYMLSANEALYEYSNVKIFKSIHSTKSRFQDEVELLRQQVFHIKCKIESQRFSPNTEYACYLVFKLSERCRGLHCPVIVRDQLHRKNKESRVLYFRSPSPCNVDNANWVPRERKNGWMEVNVWQFNSNNEFRDDCVFINLKLISYEGTMSGLIVSGLKFRPM